MTYVDGLPDIDRQETEEWTDSLRAVASERGKPRARFLLRHLIDEAGRLKLGFPAPLSTPYLNTLHHGAGEPYPGDERLEARIEALVRWNAAVMVTRANAASSGIGGHLSTFASSATLYEVGFQHFFHGKDGGAGDQVYVQGHATPGIYARAYLEGRLDEDDLDHFRREVNRKEGRCGLSSYPHPRLMPDFWEFPTVSMGLGPINAIYQARFNRYLHNRGITDTSASKVWCFLGDGECDEPESLGALAVAAREPLDNLIFVVNCNLQRLDGPVRGNGKVIQELESQFAGAGWNVIKVVWGSGWDALLAADTTGSLLDRLTHTPDGEFQKYAVEGGAYFRERFFADDPERAALVEHLSDDELKALCWGGHDRRKVYEAFRAAAAHEGVPTVVLAKSVKGHALGAD
ncbi:MAG: pyruvate dehydrogenase (acetyl-transferring), homodimeric type, partial [Acidimicrobiales bacterium]